MRFKIWLALVVLLAVIGTPYSFAESTQTREKSLDIERYPNEPLELLDIKIGEQSVKANTRSKSRRGGEGLDTVTFEGENGWFRHITVRLRNVSGKTIYGMRALLYFRPPDTRNMFSLQLSYAPRANPRGRLTPGDEVELVVDALRFDMTMELMRKQGVDADAATVILAVESASFGEDQQWNRGQILRRDPINPDRWIIK